MDFTDINLDLSVKLVKEGASTVQTSDVLSLIISAILLCVCVAGIVFAMRFRRSIKNSSASAKGVGTMKKYIAFEAIVVAGLIAWFVCLACLNAQVSAYAETSPVVPDRNEIIGTIAEDGSVSFDTFLLNNVSEESYSVKTTKFITKEEVMFVDELKTANIVLDGFDGQLYNDVPDQENQAENVHPLITGSSTNLNLSIFGLTDKSYEQLSSKSIFTISLTMKKVQMKSIELAQLPDKIHYVYDEEFNAQGMIVNAVFSDDSSIDITNDCVVDPQVFKALGDVPVKISYNAEGKTWELNPAFTVSVVPNVRSYACLNADKSILTFTYDNKWNEYDFIFDVEETGENPDWAVYVGQGTSDQSTVTAVNFNESFKNVQVKTCQNWFCGISEDNEGSNSNIENFNGIENLKTDQCENMRSMFMGCKKLDSINISSFVIQNLKDTTNMFSECISLEEIICENNWAESSILTKSEGMFEGCTKLNGYEEAQTNKDYAYPFDGEKGYFSWYMYNALSFTCDNEAEVSFACEGECSPPNMQYSYNAKNWSSWGANEVLNLPADNNKTVYVKGNNKTQFSSSAENYVHFVFVGDVKANGNVTSLIDNCDGSSVDEIPCTYCFTQLFTACETLTEAPLLPSKVLKAHCYSGMFRKCFALKQAPSLNSTNLADGCYYAMFNQAGIVNAMEILPAENLKEDCYQSMFDTCQYLKKPPVIKANVLEKGCCWGMFRNCISLKVDNQQIDSSTEFFTCPKIKNLSVDLMFQNTAGYKDDPKEGETYYYVL